MKLGILGSHPVQYYAPLFRELASRCELTVFYAHRPTASEQGRDGFGQAFEWDVDLLGGYTHRFLRNAAQVPNVSVFGGCNTPGIGAAIRDGQFDAFLVTGWGLQCYWQAVWACHRYGVRVLVRGDSQLSTPRSRFKRGLKALLYPLLLRAFDGFCVVGTRNRDYLRHYRTPSSRLFASPHAVDVATFANAARRSSVMETRTALGLSIDARLVLFVGKLIPRKRVDDVLAALALLSAGGEHMQGLIVGTGAEEAALHQQAKSLGLTVHFSGFCNQSRLPALYAAADVLVLASDGDETWGLVVNEAMACGTPAVVSSVVGCAEDLINADTGARFPVGDIPALAAALSAVCARGKDAAVQAALAAKSAEYSLQKATAGILHAAQTRRGTT